MTQDIIGNFDIKIPSLDEQIKIANILSSLDDKIAVNRKINRNLEQQAKAIFKSRFIDFEPFKDGKFVESELGMIPEGWEVKRASDIYDITIGKTPPRKESEWFSNNASDNIWVSISDMKTDGAFLGSSTEYLTNEAISKFNIVMVPKNTVLLSFKLTVGRVAISSRRLTTNEAIARFYTKNQLLREYTYLALKSYNYESLGSTSSIATAINSKIVKSMLMVLPDNKSICNFHTIVKPLFDEIEERQEENNKLSSLRDTLLPKLMSGELKV